MGLDIPLRCVDVMFTYDIVSWRLLVGKGDDSRYSKITS